MQIYTTEYESSNLCPCNVDALPPLSLPSGVLGSSVTFFSLHHLLKCLKIHTAVSDSHDTANEGVDSLESVT